MSETHHKIACDTVGVESVPTRRQQKRAISKTGRGGMVSSVNVEIWFRLMGLWVCLVVVSGCLTPKRNSRACVGEITCPVASEVYCPSPCEWVVTKLQASKRIPRGLRPYEYWLDFRKGNADQVEIVFSLYGGYTNENIRATMETDFTSDLVDAIHEATAIKKASRNEWITEKLSFAIYIYEHDGECISKAMREKLNHYKAKGINFCVEVVTNDMGEPPPPTNPPADGKR